MGMLILKVWVIGFVIQFIALSSVLFRGAFMTGEQKVMAGIPYSERNLSLTAITSVVLLTSCFWFINFAFYLYMATRGFWIWKRCPKGE